MAFKKGDLVKHKTDLDSKFPMAISTNEEAGQYVCNLGRQERQAGAGSLCRRGT